MSNYYVHRNHDYDDELAHSLGGWIKRRAQGAHKYIAKIPIGGKMRYFYTQAELAAYKAGKTVSKAATNVNNRLTVGRAQARYTVKRISDTARAKVGNAVNNLTGASAKKQMNAAKSKVDYSLSKVRAAKGTENYDSAVNRARGNMRVYNEAKGRYDKSLLGRAEKAGKAIGGAAGKARDARLKVTDAAGKVRNVVGKAGNKLLDAAGRSEKERLQRLDLNYRRRARTANLNANASYEESQRLDKLERQAGKAAGRAADSYYRHTLMGRAESAASKAKSAVSDAAYKVRSTAGKAKSAASSAAGTVRKTARKAGTAVANATGYSERQRAQRLKANADRRSHSATGGGASASWYNAYQASKKASQSYAKTPLGRIENAPRNAANAASGAARKAGKVASSAAKKVGRAVDRLDTTIYNARVDAQNKRAQATTKKSPKKRPHQRKTKKLNGTATVRKGDRVYY